jgi:OTU domain-containing protein 6
MSAKKTRSIASRYMQTHRDDFQPFLTDKNGDPIGDDDQFDAYCRSIIGSDNDIDAVWGGEPEVIFNGCLSHKLHHRSSLLTRFVH